MGNGVEIQRRMHTAAENTEVRQGSKVENVFCVVGPKNYAAFNLKDALPKEEARKAQKSYQKGRQTIL